MFPSTSFARTPHRSHARFKRKRLPARSPLSNTGHYSDATDLLDDIREEIGAQRLTPHDLRRTFGRVAKHGAGAGDLVAQFLNHAKNVTDRYMDAEWSDLKEGMAKIELEITEDVTPIPKKRARPKHKESSGLGFWSGTTASRS